MAGNLKILVIEDDPTVRSLIHTALKSVSCEVFEAGNGKEGLQIALREKPSVAILDHTVPDFLDMASKEALAVEPLKSMSYLFISARRGTQVQSRLDGVRSRVLPKPFGVQELLRTLGELTEVTSFPNHLSWKDWLKQFALLRMLSGLYWRMKFSYQLPHQILIRAAYSIFYRETIWKGVLNRKAMLQYRAHTPALTPPQREAVEALKRDGIYKMDFSTLFPSLNLGQYLSEGERWMARPEIQERVRAVERACLSREAGSHKFYLVKFWKDVVLDFSSLLMTLGLRDEILAVVSSYLGVCPRMAYADLWYNHPFKGEENYYSQRWHRDADDKKILKVFFYLRDVDMDCGATTYVPGSQDAGRHHHVFPSAAPYNCYPPEEKVEEMFPKEKQIVAAGKAGTLVFADTSGLHKGGHALLKSRFLLNIAYRTDGSFMGTEGKNWVLSDIPKMISPMARFALYQ